MKTATTPYTQALQQDEGRITGEFLISMGFTLSKETPLIDTYQHSRNWNCYVSIGLYGELTITEKHWCNQTDDRIFSTINPNVKQSDFPAIVQFLNIQKII